MSYPYKQRKINGRRIDEHRYLMECALGRRLETTEYVHHVNGDKTDNRLENLELVTPLDHGRHHFLVHPVEKKCVICGASYEPEKTKRARQQVCGRNCLSQLLSIRNQERKGQTWLRWRGAPSINESVA